MTVIAKFGFNDDYDMIKSKFEYGRLNLNLVLTSSLSILPNELSILLSQPFRQYFRVFGIQEVYI